MKRYGVLQLAVVGTVALALGACPPGERGKQEPAPTPAEIEPPEEEIFANDSDRMVRIQIIGPPPGEIDLRNRAIPVCRTSEDCDSVTWRWLNGQDEGIRAIHIDFANATEGAERCFPEHLAILADDDPREITATVNAAECPPKSAWLYSVSVDCDLCEIPPIDPGMIIQD